MKFVEFFFRLPYSYVHDLNEIRELFKSINKFKNKNNSGIENSYIEGFVLPEVKTETWQCIFPPLLQHIGLACNMRIIRYCIIYLYLMNKY
jgi:hypothetical protein